MIKTETTCRVCGGELVDLLDFGEIYPSGFVKSQEGHTKAPLVLVQCIKCTLVQLKHTVNLDLMYRQYWYSSALNKSMVSSLKNIADETQKRVELEEGDIIIDIGCNDGTLFQFFPDECFKIGFDPALNLKDRAEENCDLFINDYFRSDLLPLGVVRGAKVITSIAMFYDLPKPDAFVNEIEQVLAADGIWGVQFTDLLSMLQINAFDNICHEHLEYYKLVNLLQIFDYYDLDIFDLEYNNVNGGSLRVYVCHKGAKPIKPIVEDMFNYEKAYFEKFKEPFGSFVRRIKHAEIALKDYLARSKAAGKTTFVLGASTKGNTLLQAWGLTKEDLPYALEVNEDKFGLRTIGSDIPIISEEEGLAMQPDQLLLLPWHFITGVKANLHEYLENGGIIITPLPSFTIHYEEDGYSWILEQRASVF